MRRIETAFGTFLLVLTGVWFVSNPDVFQVTTFIGLRGYMVQYTGVLAIGLMSLIMLLAVRPVLLSQRLGGLDKAYRLHKWLGITALALSIIHWIWRMAPKWASALGLYERGPRGPRPDEGTLHWGQSFFGAQRGLAESVGEWAFYIAVVLIIVALIKWIPYRWFAKTHTLLAPVYLVLVYHGAVLLDFANWATPVGYVMAGMLAVGTVCAIIVLTGRIGRDRKSGGEVTELNYFPQMRSLEIRIKTDGGWKGHRAGQFAFARFGTSDEIHPFTIASAWHKDDPRLTIIAKELGDYTKKLPDTLKSGDAVVLEGPYGTFTLDRKHARQIWISGGIGLTPFVAWLEALAEKPESFEIDFFQVAPECDAELMVSIESLASKAGVRLHQWRDAQDGFLTGEKLRGEVPEWEQAHVWFCGPSAFGLAIKNDLVAAGLNRRAFHQELFDFR